MFRQDRVIIRLVDVFKRKPAELYIITVTGHRLAYHRYRGAAVLLGVIRYVVQVTNFQ